MNKQATVSTSDPRHPMIYVTMKGPVEKFAEIHPMRVSLIGKAGGDLKGQVVILPRDDLPFKVLEVQARNGVHIRHRLDSFEEDGRTGYRLIVENTRTEPGRYVDTLTLTTDSEIRPKLTIPVIGNIAAAIGRKTQ